MMRGNVDMESYRRSVTPEISGQLWADFFRALAGLPDGPVLTATEIIERRKEFARAIEHFMRPRVISAAE